MHTFRVEDLGHAFHVIEIEGREEISRLYRFEILVVSSERDIPLGDVVGRGAVLTLGAGNEARVVHGMVSRFEQGNDAGGHATYRVTLVPRVHRLLRGQDSRIFQGLSVPDLARTLLAEHGFGKDDVRLAIHEPHRAREYCVQYREPTWDFISRLLEEEGIRAYFEHREDAHVLWLSDVPRGHDPIGAEDTIPFRPPGGAMARGEHVSRFQAAEEVHAGRVTLRDYDALQPTRTLERATAAGRDEDIEIYDYPDTEPRAAALRLEEIAQRRRSGAGESTSARLAPGHTFVLADHPREDFNGRYLITAVEHRGKQPYPGAPAGDAGSYENRFEVIPASEPFRPLRRTPRPIVRGIQTAVVVGPAGEEIFTDDLGRIKVQFHWDRRGRRDENSSCWIRVSQASAGPGFGAMFLPRVGHEVVVDFLEGDPDRPLVVGSVYHALHRPPYALPADKTKTTIRSSTSRGGDGHNELSFEDRKGDEEVFLRGERDLTIEVGDDKRQKIGGDETLHVTGSRTVTVLGPHTETVATAQTVTVGAAQTTTVGAAQTTTVGAAQTTMVGAAMTLLVAGVKTETVGALSVEKVMGSKLSSARLNAKASAGKAMSLSAGKDLSAKAGGAMSLGAGTSATVKAGHNLTVTVGHDHLAKVARKKTVIVGEKVTVKCGASQITMDKAGKIVIQGKDISVEAAGPLQVDAKDIELKGKGPVNISSSGEVHIKGGKVGLN